MKNTIAECYPSTEGRSARGAPAIAGGVIAAYRACMVACDEWERVRQAFAQRGGREEGWLDTVSGRDWVELAGYVALLDAIGEAIGTDALRGLVRRRLIDPAGSNFYSSMLRSWARSFGESPEHMLRGAVQVWRTAQRNTGHMRAETICPGQVRLVIDGEVAELYRASPAMAASLEGLALGFLDLAKPRPVFLEVSLEVTEDPLYLACRYN